MIEHENKLAQVCDKLEIRFPIAELSKNLNYSKSAVSDFYNNKKIMSSKFKERLENYYKIDYKAFLEEKQAVLRTDFDRIVRDNRFEMREGLNNSSKSKKLGGE